MNKEIAGLLKTKIEAALIPYLTQIAGLVQTVEYAQEQRDGNKTILRMPVSYNTNDELCGEQEKQGHEFALTPDASKKGIVYFEDLGTRFEKTSAYGDAYVSNLVLVCWLNRDLITGNRYTEITASVVNDILNAFGRNPFNEMPFIRVQIFMDRINPQDKGVFAKYTYDEVAEQYLMPPYEFFSMNLSVKYIVSRKCAIPIQTGLLCDEILL